MSSIDALAEELGAFAARIEREVMQRIEAVEANARAALAGLQAKLSEMELRAVNAEHARDSRIADRLALVKDGEPGQSVTLDDLAPLVVAEVAKAVAAIPPALPGKDADPSEIARMIDAAVSAIPPAQPGRDADPEEVRRIVAELVAEAVSALPEPKPGKDADPELVAALVSAEVTKAVATIPPAEPGKDADPAVIADMVKAAVAELPPPMPGKDADPEVIRELVAEAVAALPPAPKGDPGPMGKIGAVKAWQDRVYYDGDIVSHAGALFQARQDTGREPPHDDWECVIPAAQDGQDGRSLTVRGTWSADAEYAALDIVAMDGGSFVARSDNPGACPGPDWQLLVSRGKPGKPGEPGRKGDPGPRGLQGAPVQSATVDDEGVITLRNGDGSTVTVDLYPVLDRIAK